MSDQIRSSILRHLRYTVGADADTATALEWRTALSLALRDLAMDPWAEATRITTDEDRKRVYYLSMEFLTGRLIEDAAINLGVRDEVERSLAELDVSFADLVAREPDPALGNGGLGRLAACYLESMATLQLPAFGYGLRYERGLFRQSFDEGRQVEHPDEWLGDGSPWSLAKPSDTHRVFFGGSLEGETWTPESSIVAGAFDTPVAGYGGRWVNTLRLWAASADPDLIDLGRFNTGDFFGAADAETWAKTLSRVLYPADETELGKRLRLSQEYFLTSASVQDLLARYTSRHTDLERLPEFVAIQMNDTHPAIAGPELIRLLIDEHGFSFDRAADVATDVLGYTNHTLLPEALEHWSVELMGSLLPRHLQIIEKLDARIHATYGPAADGVHLIDHGQVRMGDLAAWTSHRVNGVSALHSELVRTDLFSALDELEPERIVNVTNGITPRRWLKLANPALAQLITDTLGEGWETDLERLRGLEQYADDPAFLDAFGRTKHEAKQRFIGWARDEHGIDVPQDALYDVQIKRIHEYKRQLLNILWTIARYQQIKQDPGAGWVPRVKIFGGKAAPSYAVAKDIIRLINDVASVVNADPDTRDLLRVIYPPNYNVTMAEKLIPAADLSEQISTAGMEASGTGNMKFALNGALTIGTLDGANVEIRDEVGHDNFFLFGLTTEEVAERRTKKNHARTAIEKSPVLRGVLDAIAAGAFSPDEPGRYGGILDLVWNSDWFLVASDFDAYDSAQQVVDLTYRDPRQWQRKAVLNIARMGFFSSDRAIREYMSEIWNVGPAR